MFLPNYFFLWMLKFYAWLQNLNVDIWGKALLCPVFYFSPLLEFLVPITVRLNQYLSSVTLSRFCWWSQLEIKRSPQSERRTPLRLSKEIVATTSFILYATSDRNQMKRKKRDSCPKIALSPSFHARIMYTNCTWVFPIRNVINLLYPFLKKKKTFKSKSICFLS